MNGERKARGLKHKQETEEVKHRSQAQKTKRRSTRSAMEIGTE